MRVQFPPVTPARVVKLADTLDLGSSASQREGSSPSSGTNAQEYVNFVHNVLNMHNNFTYMNKEKQLQELKEKASKFDEVPLALKLQIAKLQNELYPDNDEDCLMCGS